MTPRFNLVTIIGVGLLGGSLGLALKARGLAARIRGVGHRQSSLDKAVDVGAVDEVSLEARTACRDADLVVVCTPAALVSAKLDEIRPVCTASTTVTDVASTKSAICAHARATWPRPLRFIGSHPMAGSEKFGPEHATPNLYAGSTTIVARQDRVDPDAHETVCALWRGVGSTVVEFEPDVHDALVACTSHLPHILAACIAQLAADRSKMPPGLDGVRAVTGSGFRDTTRIAASRPEVWRDICLTNRDAVLDAMAELIELLAEVRRGVASSDADAIETFFRSGQQARKKVLGE